MTPAQAHDFNTRDERIAAYVFGGADSANNPRTGMSEDIDSAESSASPTPKNEWVFKGYRVPVCATLAEVVRWR